MTVDLSILATLYNHTMVKWQNIPWCNGKIQILKTILCYLLAATKFTKITERLDLDYSYRI